MDNIKEYILSNKENSRELLNIIFKSIKPIEIRRNLIDYGIKMKDFKLISMAQKIEYLECNKYMCKPLQFSDIKLIKIKRINSKNKPRNNTKKKFFLASFSVFSG